jgi:hypothetical protein
MCSKDWLMSSVSPTSQYLARELLALESARGKGARGNGKNGGRQGLDSAVRVCEKLREVLVAFAGKSGYRSLLTRALTLAKAQEGSLEGVEVLEDGRLSEVEAYGGKIGNEMGRRALELGMEGGRILVAQLLDLLVIFIGEPLMHQLVRSAWPNVPKGAFGSRTKDTL